MFAKIMNVPAAQLLFCVLCVNSMLSRSLPVGAYRTDSIPLSTSTSADDNDEGILPLIVPTTQIVENERTQTKFPLVVFMHGFCLDPQRQIETMAGFKQLVDSEQFALALPSGPSNGGGVMLPICRTWDGTDGSRFMLPLYMTKPQGDVPFVKNVVAKSVEHMNKIGKPVDPSRIYAMGVANGAFMAHRIACDMPDVFAAVSAYTGATGANDADSTCKRNWETLGGTNVLQLHGDADTWVPYEGGINWPGSAESARLVASGMGCDVNKKRTDETTMGGFAVTETSYDTCPAGTSSVEWRVKGMDHLPEGGSGLKPLLQRALDWMLDHEKPGASDATLTAALKGASPGNGGDANAPRATPLTGVSAGSVLNFLGGRPQMLAEFAGAAVGEAGRSSSLAAGGRR